MSINISFSDGEFKIATNTKGSPKRQKGNSFLEFPKDYTIIDLETTGFDARYDEIIEIGCIKYRNNKEVAKFQTLIQPAPSYEYDDNDNKTAMYYVDDFISELTGITNEMLVSAPRFESISNDLQAFLKDELLMGHNVNFDINFLYDYFLKYNEYIFRNNFVDTLRLSRRVLPELPNYKLKTIADYYDITNTYHRALADCQTTYQIFTQLSQKAHAENIDLTLSPKHKKNDLRKITPDSTTFDSDNIFYNKNCVFTGKLEKFERKVAAQLATNIGAHCENGVTKKTNFLIIGSFQDVVSVKDNKSSKIKKAEKLILEGQDLQIISEHTFYDYISEELEKQQEKND
ncbi:exonuclease domain-containing protein [Pectinatus brassicae]|uniref:DNA polymerase-3 subunit epsilon n=1 Tax=Pectinatus brassicae TaxID=862415 RepID=A0A840UNS2_9FIRM|nr:exonuclease domain-containing protein [Pectinatus brassicae]MBB5337557.1 DNA polymerase-3 subunit epsilon [Pectinatus brassicae]